MSTQSIGIKIWGDLKDLTTALNKGTNDVGQFSKEAKAAFKNLTADIREGENQIKMLTMAFGKNSNEVKQATASLKPFQDKLKEATNAGSNHASVMETLKGSWAAISGVLAGSAFAFKVVKDAIASSDAATDKWKEMLGGATLMYQKFLAVVSTGNFSNLIDGLSAAYEAGVKVAAMLDEVMHRQLSLNISHAKESLEGAQLLSLMRNRLLTDEQRIAYGNQYKEIQKKIAADEVEQAKSTLEAYKLQGEAKTGLAGVSLLKFIAEYKQNEELITQSKRYLETVSGLDKLERSGAKGPDVKKAINEMQTAINSASPAVKAYSVIVSRATALSEEEMKQLSDAAANVYKQQQSYYDSTRRANSMVSSMMAKEGDLEVREGVKAVKDAESAKKKAISDTKQAFEDQIKSVQNLNKDISTLMKELRGGHGSEGFSAGKYSAPMLSTGVPAPGSMNKIDSNTVIPQMGAVIDYSKAEKEMIALKDAISGATSALGGLGTSFQNVFASLGDVFVKFKEGFTGGWREMAASIGSVMQNAVSFVSDLFAQQTTTRLQQLDDTYNAERERIDGSTMNEKSKQKALDKLDRDAAKQKKALLRQQAKDNKEASIVQAIIAGALGVIQATNAPPPLDIVLPILIGALTAVHIATIISQPLPALAMGGLAYAPQLALVGDNPNAMHDPEVISPLSKLKQYMGGGDSGGGELTTRVKGDDLLFVLNRAKISQNRRY